MGEPGLCSGQEQQDGFSHYYFIELLIAPVGPFERRPDCFLLIIKRHSVESFEVCFFKDASLWEGLQGLVI